MTKKKKTVSLRSAVILKNKNQHFKSLKKLVENVKYCVDSAGELLGNETKNNSKLKFTVSTR